MPHLDLRTYLVHFGDKQLLIQTPDGEAVVAFKNGEFPIMADVEVHHPKDPVTDPVARRWLYGTVGEPRPDFMREEMIDVVVRMKVPSSQLSIHLK